MVRWPTHDGANAPSCDAQQRVSFFSLVEIVVTVLIMAILVTFSTLQFQQSHRPEQLQETARQLSLFLKSSAMRSGLSQDEIPVLLIDREVGTFSLTPKMETLDDFKLPKGILIGDIIGAEGSVWEDEDTVEISLPPQGLQESLQINLYADDLKPWTLTWKLKGLVCSVDQTPDIHWPQSVERF
jgi:type II secretory pathway pseudopilin PulG